MKKKSDHFNEDVINFIPYLNKLYLHKNKILFCCFIFFIFGFAIIINTEEKYISNIKFSLLATQSSSAAASSSLSGLASLAGFDLNFNQSQNILNPQLYSLVFNDFSFKRDLLKIELDDKTSFKDYIINNNKPSFFDKVYFGIMNMPKNFISFIKGSSENYNNNKYNLDSKYFITDEEKGIFSFINNSVNISYDQNKMILDISSELNNPVFSTIITKGAFDLLEKKIIDLNIKSSKDVLAFNLKNYNEKKKEYINAQNKLAEFNDNNKVISSSRFNTEFFILDNEFKLINNVFQELSKQVELSKIQITKDTPVFNILTDASVPKSKSQPKTLFILVFSVIFGFLFSSIYILFKDFFLKIFNMITK